MMKLPIYFDYSSTTPMDPRIIEKMMQCLTINGIFGNPSSLSHYYGWQAEEIIDISRNHIASLIGSNSNEIIFTSGATESDNLAIKGVAYANKYKGKHIITSLTEHRAVLDTCDFLEKKGFKITKLKPQKNGIILPEQLIKSFRDETILVSLMHVNNETGIIQDIKKLGNLCKERKIIFHVDGTQSVGKLFINVSELPIDLMSFSGHKLYGPKGIGCLFIRKKPPINIETQIHGGKHQFGIRSGTLPVHQIVGFGEACKIAKKEMLKESVKIGNFRKILWNGFNQIGIKIGINTDLQNSIYTLLNINFGKINGEFLISLMKNIAVSRGSACNFGKIEPSYVLRAMGLSYLDANNAIRFSLGRFTTQEEIEYSVEYIKKIISRIIKKRFIF